MYSRLDIAALAQQGLAANPAVDLNAADTAAYALVLADELIAQHGATIDNEMNDDEDGW